MSAREQARKAAVKAAQPKGSTNIGDAPSPGVLADAASDVWEPLLRETLEALDIVKRQTANRIGCAHAYAEARDLSKKIKEALGE